MPNVLTPNAKQQFFDNNGNPAAGYKVFTYAAGTSTKLATKVSPSGADNANPIILDYRGECNLWIAPNVSYKYVYAPPTDTDPPTHAIWTVDNIVSSQLITLYGGVDTGSVNAYILTFTANFTAYTDGIVIYWIPANANTGASTVNVNGLGPIAIKNADGSALVAGELQANVPATILYKGGSFVLVTTINPSSTGGSFTATVTGCTTAPTVTITWAKSGRVVTLVCPGVGALTSNSVNFGLTGVPTNLQTGLTATRVLVGGLFASDNSVALYGTGGAHMDGASGSIVFEYKGTSAWTAAGTKSIGGFVLVYPVASDFT